MTRALYRRAELAFGAAAEHTSESKWIIWCLEPKNMPAMIDLLIAQGQLAESDRPQCLHWTAVRPHGPRPQEEVAKTLDAEKMLSKAGIRTMTMETCEPPIREQGELEAWFRDRVRDQPETLEWLDRVLGDSTDHEAAVKPTPEE